MSRIELEQVRVGTPCPMRWEELDGDERKRFCGHCSLHVHNLSVLPRREAQELLDERTSGGGRLCITVQRRADGSVVTADDPRPPARAGGWVRALSAAASLLFGLFPFLAACRPADGTPVPVESANGGEGSGSEGPCIELLGEVVAPTEQIVGRIAVPEHGEVPQEPGGVSVELGDVLLPEEAHEPPPER